MCLFSSCFLGKDEFVTGENVLVFGKGVRRKSTTFFVSDDDIPEVLVVLLFLVYVLLFIVC